MDSVPGPVHKTLDFLKPEEVRCATFVKPAPGKELEALHEAGSITKAQILAVRRLTLQPGTVIPFHVHDRKEKLYIVEGPGFIRVLVLLKHGGGWVPLGKGDQLIVPAGCEHFVKYFLAGPNSPYIPCCVLVVSSSQDGKDIRWDPETDELVKNKHLKSPGSASEATV